MNKNIKYPDGRLNDNDEGRLKIVLYIKDSRLVIEFGKDLSWIGFDKEGLRTFIDSLEDKYKQL